MDDFMGVSSKKIIELVLAILALVFFAISTGVKFDVPLHVLTVVVVVYLALVVLMACARREIFGGGVSALECAAGLMLLVHSIVGLSGGSRDGLYLAAIIMDLILGVLFLIFVIY